MRIVLLGGGSGGHFYPLIAVAHALRDIAEEERIVSLDLVLMGDKPFDIKELENENIQFDHVSTGKVRRYFSLRNFSDSLRTFRGIIQSLWKFTVHPPDVIFSKGGFDAFPALFAARIYRIPVMIHESDSIPGKVNSWSGKFARRIGISFPEAGKYFPSDKVALTGNPIRHAVLGGSRDEAFDMFGLESGVPIILILGGSQGSQKMNDTVVEMLPTLLEQAQVIHSIGGTDYESISGQAEVSLEENTHAKRYHPFPYMSAGQLRNASFVADCVTSRSGAGAIFEIAAWHAPAILIPLPNSAQDHARENAYDYARAGAAIVVEESNLTAHILEAEILKIVGDEKKKAEMKQAASAFARIDAARKIADELIRLGIHE